MTKKNDITLPTPEDERLLNDVLEDSVDYVEVRGKKYGISWLKRGRLYANSPVPCRNRGMMIRSVANVQPLSF